MNSSTKILLNNLIRRRTRIQKPTVINSFGATMTTTILRPISIVPASNLSTCSGQHNNTNICCRIANTASMKSSRSHIDSLQIVVKRWRHSGKRGNHLQTLEELAHRPEREAAEEKRKKKKERKAAKRKGKKHAADEQQEPPPAAEATNEMASTSPPTSSSETDFDDDWDDDIDFEDEESINEDEDAEPSLPDTDVVKDQMEVVVKKFEESLKSIRGAEPTADMFDDIQVNAYGSMTPLKAVGQVVIASPTLAQITCFDPAVAKDVAKSIQLALSLNPQIEEGGNVRVPLPRVSMEVREQTAKALNKKAESCRQRLRKVRRKAMDRVKKGKDGKLAGISKDDAFATGKEVEAVTESSMSMLQEIVDKKMDSIMAV